MSFIPEFEYRLINPKIRSNLQDQVDQCLQQIEHTVNSDISELMLLKCIWFCDVEHFAEFKAIREKVLGDGSSIFLDLVVHSFISEAPTEGYNIQVLLLGLSGNTSVGELAKHDVAGAQYVKFFFKDQAWLLFGDAGYSENDISVEQTADQAFKTIDQILQAEDMHFQHLIRLWNFVPGIVAIERQENRLVQNYQILNETRSKWFDMKGMNHDFPAATGIGCDLGGVVVEGIAFKASGNKLIISLSNPDQISAHKYSKDRLIGEEASSAPKFERGKLLLSGKDGCVFVSGTAAIKGELSVGHVVKEQLNLTLDNISKLIAIENLKNCGLPAGSYALLPVYFRAYVKHHCDGILVREILQQNYPGAIVHVLKASICRDELLVEVEGEFRLNRLE